MTIEAFAPAKINLTLHVTGQRADGYHLLDSLVVFADVGDRLWLDPGPDLKIELSGPFAQGVPDDGRNLVWRAAEQAGWTGTIRLHKTLPHGGGIGGGSSDAAAVLRALDVDDDGLRLGADVPVCKGARAAIMQGIGDQVVPVAQPLPPFFAVLVNPGVHVPTPAVFRALTKTSNPAMTACPDMPDVDAWLRWLHAQRNDLEAAAVAQAPDIQQVLSALTDTEDCLLARMSGSGSTCFGLFPTGDAAQAAADHMRSARPDWWVTACVLS